MAKKILIILLSLAVLSACGNSEPIGKFEDVKIVDKKKTEECFKGCYNEYFVTLEKSGEKISLQVPTEEMYNAVKKGNTVTVSYDEEYEILELKFKIQSKN